MGSGAVTTLALPFLGEAGPVTVWVVVLVFVFLECAFALIDILPWGRQEEWQDSPEGWPQSPTYSKWLDSPDVARLYGPNGDAQ